MSLRKNVRDVLNSITVELRASLKIRKTSQSVTSFLAFRVAFTTAAKTLLYFS